MNTDQVQNAPSPEPQISSISPAVDSEINLPAITTYESALEAISMVKGKTTDKNADKLLTQLASFFSVRIEGKARKDMSDSTTRESAVSDRVRSTRSSFTRPKRPEAPSSAPSSDFSQPILG